MKDPSVVNINPCESTHFRIIQSISEEGNVSSPPTADEQPALCIVEDEGPEMEPLQRSADVDIESLGAAAAAPMYEEATPLTVCLSQPQAQPSSKTDSPSKKKGTLVKLSAFSGTCIEGMQIITRVVAAWKFCFFVISPSLCTQGFLLTAPGFYLKLGYNFQMFALLPSVGENRYSAIAIKLYSGYHSIL